MNIIKKNRNILLFIGFLLIAGIANVLSRFLPPVSASLMTALNYVILTGLLLFWIQSVRVRLLPSEARKSVLGAAVLMLAYMLIRIFKYRFAVEPFTLHYCVYAYWIPQVLIPTLFLITCIRIRHIEKNDLKHRELLLLIPAVLLVLTVMSNDLHFLVYRAKVDLSVFAADSGTYAYGPGFYLLYVWIILTFVSGFILLCREAGRMPKGVLRDILLVTILWVAIILFDILYLDVHTLPRLFNVPETHTFFLLGIFEICIRYRLIPYNENYSGFFHNLKMPVMITDRQYQPVYSSSAELSADENDLKASLASAVDLPFDRTLHGKAIHAGYAFWAIDESEIRHAHHKLSEANETIEQENDLIRAETEQKEKDAYLQSQHRIYHEIAEELYPVQKRISSLLDSVKPGEADFRKTIAEVSVLNAYVKRKTNLLLLSLEKDHLSIGELALALQESAHYLTLSGLQTTAVIAGDELLPSDCIIALYDGFEHIAEQLCTKAPSLMVSWNGGSLRLAAETACIPDTEGISLPVNIRQSDGILYVDIALRKEEAL